MIWGVIKSGKRVLILCWTKYSFSYAKEECISKVNVTYFRQNKIQFFLKENIFFEEFFFRRIFSTNFDEFRRISTNFFDEFFRRIFFSTIFFSTNFFFDEYFRRILIFSIIFFLLTIASFRIGVPSILFFHCLKWNGIK